MSLVDFKELKESWGSEYIITEGEFKDYRISCKVIVERIYPKDEVDDVGLPRFNISHHVVMRVLPPTQKP
jgi:hypothetical protein